MSQTGVYLRDVQAQTVTISGVTVGFSAPEVQQLIQAVLAGAGATQQHAAQIAELATQLRATQAAVREMLRSLGHDDVPVERLPDALAAAATQILTMRQALSRPSNESDTADLRNQAVTALDAGAFDEATRLLNVIRAREREASEQRRRAAEESRADWLAALQSEAETCALLARAALAQRDVPGARAQFEEGLRVLAPADPAPRWSYAFDAARAFYDLGERAGLNEALQAAIQFYQLALTNVTRELVPLAWAGTQNALGTALSTLGERESGTARLEEAVEACRDALQERTRERVPLDWAMTQNNLGAALSRLGERESGTARLEEAVAAYDAALTVFVPAQADYYTDGCRANQAKALALLAERTG